MGRVDSDMGDWVIWVAGTGVHEEVAGAKAGAGAEQRPEAAAGGAVVRAGASTGGAGPGTTDARRAAVKQVRAVEGAPGEVQGRKWEDMNEARLKELEAPGEEWGMVMLSVTDAGVGTECVCHR